MNEFDLLLIFILLLGTVYGAFRGALRQVTGLVSAWLAIIIDLWTYRLLSDKILLGQFKGASPVVMESFAFIILLIIYAILLQMIFIYSTKSPEEKQKKQKSKGLNEMLDEIDKGPNTGILNTLGGLVTGFIATAVWLSLLLALTHYFLYGLPNTAPALKASMSHSTLLPIFARVLRVLYATITPFYPKALPAIFSAMLS